MSKTETKIAFGIFTIISIICFGIFLLSYNPICYIPIVISLIGMIILHTRMIQAELKGDRK